MRRLTTIIRKMTDISGRDWTVFLLSLLLAFSIWMIHNLSLRYSAFVQVAVEAESSIEGHSAYSSNREDVIARCRVSGYNIVRFGTHSSRKTVHVKFDPAVMKHKSGEIYYITSSDLKEYAHLIFGASAEIEYYVTDTLEFRFPYEYHKKVAVNPVLIVDYRPQYTSVSPLAVWPDSVVIYGEPSFLDNVDMVQTEPVKLVNLESSAHGMVRLEKTKGIRYSIDEVEYSLPVTRFVEIPLTVSIQSRNVPQGKSMMIYPSEAEVVLKCSYPAGNVLEDELRFFIDYSDYISSSRGRCIPKPFNMPDCVIDYKMTPAAFECVLKDE